MDPRRDIGDLLQLIEEHHLAAPLVGHARGDEPISQEVFTLLGNALDALPGAVVIGHHESLAGHEGGGAVAGVAQGREAWMIQPARGRLKAVALVPVLEGRDVELPHLAGLEAGVLLQWCLLRRNRCRGLDEQEQGEDQDRADRHKCPRG